MPEKAIQTSPQVRRWTSGVGPEEERCGRSVTTVVVMVMSSDGENLIFGDTSDEKTRAGAIEVGSTTLKAALGVNTGGMMGLSCSLINAQTLTIASYYGALVIPVEPLLRMPGVR